VLQPLAGLGDELLDLPALWDGFIFSPVSVSNRQIRGASGVVSKLVADVAVVVTDTGLTDEDRVLVIVRVLIIIIVYNNV